MRVDGLMQFRCDMTTLYRLIDRTPKFPIEDGVRRTYDYAKAPWQSQASRP